jgi:hypothetical protein
MISHMSQGVDGKSWKEIHFLHNFTNWVLQILSHLKRISSSRLGRTREEVGNIYS